MLWRAGTGRCDRPPALIVDRQPIGCRALVAPGCQVAMAASEVNVHWQPEMAELIDPPTGPATGFHRLMADVFHLD